MTLKEKIGLSALAAMAAIGASLLAAPGAKAMPDPFMPLPPVWCAGGGIQSPYGGWCNGKIYPDGTQLHADNVLGYWRPIMCVIANMPAPPPPAPPGGCGGFA